MARPLLAAGVLWVVSAAGALAQADALPGALDREIPQLLAALEIPGLAVGIIRNDSLTYARGFGVLEAGGSRAVDEHTVFAVGSTTKAFTAAALGMLVDAGRLRWDDVVADHMPSFRLHDPWLTRQVTVRDLLAHRVGTERADAAWYGVDIDRSELLERLPQLRPGVGLRNGMAYNNLMYLAAGELLAHLAGVSWDDFLRERIFDPLDMGGATTSIHQLAGLSNVAQPHARRDGTVQRVGYRSLDAVAPAGSINASARDMAQWVRMQLGNGALGEQRLLAESTHRDTWTPQITAGAGLGGNRSVLAAAGLGWIVQDYRGHRLIWHNGGIDGMHAMVALLPSVNAGVVVLANLSGTGAPEAVALRIADAYLGADPGDWVGDLTRRQAAGGSAPAREPLRIADAAPPLPPARFAGTYHDPLYGSAVVDEADGRLRLRFGGNTARLEHWHLATYRVVWDDAMRPSEFATFTLDARGRPATVRLERLTTFHRREEP